MTARTAMAADRVLCCFQWRFGLRIGTSTLCVLGLHWCYETTITDLEIWTFGIDISDLGICCRLQFVAITVFPTWFGQFWVESLWLIRQNFIDNYNNIDLSVLLVWRQPVPMPTCGLCLFCCRCYMYGCTVKIRPCLWPRACSITYSYNFGLQYPEHVRHLLLQFCRQFPCEFYGLMSCIECIHNSPFLHFCGCWS